MRLLLPVVLCLTLGACSFTDDGPAIAPADPGLPLPQLQSCDQIEAAFTNELASIQACTRDADCGLVLEGTSCGCTREKVARLDADTTRFYAILDRALDRQCDVPIGSTCDCPPAGGFACVQNRCTWNYVGR